MWNKEDLFQQSPTGQRRQLPGGSVYNYETQPGYNTEYCQEFGGLQIPECGTYMGAAQEGNSMNKYPDSSQMGIGNYYNGYFPDQT